VKIIFALVAIVFTLVKTVRTLAKIMFALVAIVFALVKTVRLWG
jgi:hypothetical protein